MQYFVLSVLFRASRVCLPVRGPVVCWVWRTGRGSGSTRQTAAQRLCFQPVDWGSHWPRWWNIPAARPPKLATVPPWIVVHSVAPVSARPRRPVLSKSKGDPFSQFKPKSQECRVIRHAKAVSQRPEPVPGQVFCPGCDLCPSVCPSPWHTPRGTF